MRAASTRAVDAHADDFRRFAGKPCFTDASR
jgi:hypothetical protein